MAGLLLTVGLVGLLPPAAAGVDAECDPVPIGRCGAFQRESVIHCYILQGNRFLPATDAHVVGLGGAPPDKLVTLDSEEKSTLYLRLGPAESFLADPWEAPLPVGTLYQESNNVAGLQPAPFKCGTFVWFEECEPPQWMGPFNVIAKDPDKRHL